MDRMKEEGMQHHLNDVGSKIASRSVHGADVCTSLADSTPSKVVKT